jgi:Spy/CpxP family protein refolding chaperone
MNSQILKVSLVFILLISLSALSGCYRHEDRRLSNSLTFDYQKHTGEISRELQLTEDQEKRLEQLISSFEEKRNELKEGHTLIKQVVQQLSKEQFDELYIKSSISNYLKGVEEISIGFTEQLSSFHKMLTTEQRSLLAKHIAAAGEGYHQHRFVY